MLSFAYRPDTQTLILVGNLVTYNLRNGVLATPAVSPSPCIQMISHTSPTDVNICLALKYGSAVAYFALLFSLQSCIALTQA